MTRAPEKIAIGLGAISAALILAVLGFQYLGGIEPCEMCQWQRWPHFAAIAIGLGGGALLLMGAVPARAAPWIARLAALLIAISGAIGVYHAGVEWHIFPGPAACTGPVFKFTGTLDLNAIGPRCDVAAWRLLGISLAGYNAIVSLGVAAIAAFLLTRKKP
ncbi:MAG TPA: disulfide bond formation protein B [Rhizomicrobium sp.]|nr:disulfide bond formation protein B [Rhizomicrobium sp.]